MRWHSSTLDARSFMKADCDYDHSQVVAEVRERMAASKQAAQKFDGERFNLGKLNELGNSSRLRFQTDLQLWRT